MVFGQCFFSATCFSFGKTSKINIRGVLPLFSLSLEAKHLAGLWIFLVSVGPAGLEGVSPSPPKKLFSGMGGWGFSLRSA
jgi:hypothetical protein